MINEICRIFHDWRGGGGGGGGNLFLYEIMNYLGRRGNFSFHSVYIGISLLCQFRLLKQGEGLDCQVILQFLFIYIEFYCPLNVLNQSEGSWSIQAMPCPLGAGRHIPQHN